MNPQPSKQFRWIGQPSEEELLGIPVSATRRHHRAVVSAAKAPPMRRVVVGPSPARRLQGRDFLTVLAAAALVWLAVGAAGGSFRSSGATALAPQATDPTPNLVVLDRAELGTLPRTIAPQVAEDRSSPRGRSRDRGSRPDQKKDPLPPGGGGENAEEKPLIEATLPVVGTVTVEEPELPLPETAELPPVPELPLP